MADFLNTLLGGAFDFLGVNSTNKTNKQIAAATNQANMQMNQANIDYQRELNQQIFQREDTSYQRTVQDMINAGLSPSMMTSTNGAGGTVSAPANTFGAVGYEAQASKFGQILASADGLLDLYGKAADIQNTLTDTKFKNPSSKYLSLLEGVAQSMDPNSSAYKDLMTIVDALKSRVENNPLLGDMSGLFENPVDTIKNKVSDIAGKTGEIASDLLNSNPVKQVEEKVNQAFNNVSEKTNSLKSMFESWNLKRQGKKRAKNIEKQSQKEDRKRKVDSKKVEEMQYKVR